MIMKRIWLALPLVFAVTACSKIDERAQDDVRSEPASAVNDERLPGVSGSVAPGVAFDLNFEFSLPEAKIAAVQEEHTVMCGRLGVARCRVTGVSFEKERDGRIAASTQFRLHPALALGFAKDATALVERVEGSLETSRVQGDDAGKAIVDGDRSEDGIRADLAKIEAQLRIPGLSRDARERLAAQSSKLREQARELATSRAANVESIATTPVTFVYEAKVTGLALGDPVKQGLNASATSISALLSFLAFAFGTIGPWALLAGGMLWAFRRLRRRTSALSSAD